MANGNLLMRTNYEDFIDFFEINREIKNKIISFLELKDYLNLMLVNKLYKQLILKDFYVKKKKK